MSVSAPPVFSVAAGRPFSASLIVPAGYDSSWRIGARVEAPVTREVVSYWQEAGLTGSVLTVTLDAPARPGGYELVWRTADGFVPSFEAMVPLVVTSDIGTPPPELPVIDAADVRPSVDDVAQLERTRTITQGGEDAGTFMDDTNPTADEVEQIIDQATDDILAQLPYRRINPDHYLQIRRAITFQAAIEIELSYYREQANDQGVGFWRDNVTGIVAALQARIDTDLAQQNLLGGMEPYTVTPQGMLA